MSRIYKFRAWNGNIMYVPDALLQRDLRDFESFPAVVLERGFDEDDIHEDHILMQYTGLKDKNGKEIYEGDIIREASEERHWGNIEVIYHDAQYIPRSCQWSLAGFVRNYDIEVIGNIYENKELLEDNND